MAPVCTGIAVAFALGIPSLAGAEPRAGAVGELGIGIAAMSYESEDATWLQPSTIEFGVGVSFGVGGYLSRCTALLVRGRVAIGRSERSAVCVSCEYQQTLSATLGPSILYWVSPKVWLGAGIGFGAVTIGGGRVEGPGVSLHARAALAFSRFAALSLELTPIITHDAGQTGWGYLQSDVSIQLLFD